ncbi:transposase domain-containing protein [Streptomyces sp. NPDC002540]
MLLTGRGNASSVGLDAIPVTLARYRIALGVLTQAFPPELVDEVVAECGRAERRQRPLPARLVVYFVLAMCLFAGQGYEEVARLLTHGLERMGRWKGTWRVSTTATIGRARLRLGPEPTRSLFARECRPVACAPPPRLATEETTRSWYRGWRLVAVDGTTFDLPDTEANAAFFGRPGVSRGQTRAPARRHAWSRWPNAAPTPSSLPRRAP